MASRKPAQQQGPVRVRQGCLTIRPGHGSVTARPAESGSAGRGFGPCGDAWYERTCGGLLRVNCSRSEIWSEFRRLHSIEHTSSKSLCVDSVQTRSTRRRSDRSALGDDRTTERLGSAAGRRGRRRSPKECQSRDRSAASTGSQCPRPAGRSPGVTNRPAMPGLKYSRNRSGSACGSASAT